MFVLQFVLVIVCLCNCTPTVFCQNSDKGFLFMKWFHYHNGVSNNIVVSNFTDMGRGIKANAPITNGEEILFIPNDILLSRDLLLKSTDALHRRIAYEFESSEQCVIATLLLEKTRGENSKWIPYMNILPTYVPNLSFFSLASLNALVNPQLKAEALQTQKTISDNYKKFLSIVSNFWPNPHAITFEEYMWANSIVDSRGLRFQGQVVLAPYADMFNYQSNGIERQQQSGVFFLKHHILNMHVQGGGLTITADRDCESGAQLFEDYGDNADNIYISYHGFVPDFNPFRCVPVSAPDMVSIKKMHRKILEILQFKQAPTKCTSYPTISKSDKNPNSNPVFSSAFAVYASTIVMEKSEVTRCMHTLTEHTVYKHPKTATASDRKNYWSQLFDVCGYNNITKMISILSIPTENASPTQKVELEGLVDALVEDVGSLSLEKRTLNKLVDMICKQFMAQYHPSSTGIESGAGVEGVVASYEEEMSHPVPYDESNRTAVHDHLAYRYRSAMKKLYVQLLMLFDLDSRASQLAVDRRAGFTDRTDAALELKKEIVSITSVSEGPNTGTNPPLGELLQEFNDWVNASGPSVMNIRAVELPLPYRVGTIATADIKQQELYLTVPVSIILNNEKAVDDPTFYAMIQALNSKYRSSDEFHELLLLLVYHKFILKENSEYYPYLRLLPSIDELGTPILWSEVDLVARLGPSHITASAIEERARIHKTYDFISNIPIIVAHFKQFLESNGMNPEDGLTLNQYLWANSILNSRSIWYRGKRNLIPLLDFINCDEGPATGHVHATTIETIDNKEYAVTKAGWSVNSGDQLFENYGQPNHIYYLYHGFTLPTNRHDCVHSVLELTKSEMGRIDWKVAKPIATVS